LILTLLFAFSACKKEEGDLKVNQEPETTFSIKEINLSGDDRLNSIVSLEWYGKDPDGYIVGYELSQDGNNWFYTTKQDSTFQFSLDGGADTADIELYVRAIDNENAKDPSPDYLRIPIKNTAPTIEFNQDLSPSDTSYLVTTIQWKANDLDGIETITGIEISTDGVNWTNISRTENTLSIVPINASSSGVTQGSIYYESSTNASSHVLEGLKVNDTNKLFVRAIDQAGAYSQIDTSETFYLKGKINNTLLVGGVPAANAGYASLLQAANVPFDFIDYGSNSGENQPAIWNVTFRLLINQYDKLILYSDATGFINGYTNVKGLILEFAATSLQEFANNGGKYIIASAFDHDTEIDAFVGILPIQSVSTKNYGDARLYRKNGSFPAEDSLVESNLPNFPTLTASPINSSAIALSGVGVFNINTADSEVLYEAALSDRRPNVAWPDTKIIASGRRSAGKLNQVYFSVQLIELNGQSNMPNLIDYLINTEFN
tara:strand:- start:514 stop:1980 length:1467 start_codon:yes stop_codon:yes gene_type:complete